MRIYPQLFLLVLTASLGSTMSGTHACAWAEETKIEVSAPNALHDGLQALVGRGISVRLKGGEELSGVLEAVGPAAIRIGQLTGKEFYSAVVVIDDISAFVYRKNA